MGEVVSFARALKWAARPSDDSETTSIYVISSSAGHAKVGVSGDPRKRLEGLQRSNATKLRLIYASVRFPRREALRIEGLVHQELIAFRLRHEWFACDHRKALQAIISVGERIQVGDLSL